MFKIGLKNFYFVKVLLQCVLYDHVLLNVQVCFIHYRANQKAKKQLDN